MTTYIAPTDLSHTCFAGYFSYHVLAADKVLRDVCSFNDVAHVSTEVSLPTLTLVVISDHFVQVAQRLEAAQTRTSVFVRVQILDVG